MSETTTRPGRLTLVLGGTRSGKSRIAEDLAEKCGPAVAYVATAMVEPGDDDHQARISAHRERRPTTWTTVECSDPTTLPALLAEIEGTVLLDSLGSWVARHPDLDADGPALAAALAGRSAPTIVVAEEVGWSLHAPTEVGRRFVDAVGILNQQVAAVADDVLLVVAGRALRLPPAESLDRC